MLTFILGIIAVCLVARTFPTLFGLAVLGGIGLLVWMALFN